MIKEVVQENDSTGTSKDADLIGCPNDVPKNTDTAKAGNQSVSEDDVTSTCVSSNILNTSLDSKPNSPTPGEMTHGLPNSINSALEQKKQNSNNSSDNIECAIGGPDSSVVYVHGNTDDICQEDKEAQKELTNNSELQTLLCDSSIELNNETNTDDSDDEPLSNKANIGNNSDNSEDECLSTLKETSKAVKDKHKQRKALEEELQSIHSESQRLARESAVSLPYHKPQIKSLSDFLKRKSISKDNDSPKNNPTHPKDKLVSAIKENAQEKTSSTKPEFKTPQLSEFKKRLLTKNCVASLTPKLSEESKYVELDIDAKSKGVDDLMSRFFKHNLKKVEPVSQEVKLHLVCKDLDNNGHENLKAKEITVKLQQDLTGTPLNTEKFSAYKGQLLSRITKKKLLKQESILASQDLDNEEGFEEEEEESDSDENHSGESGDSEIEDVLEDGENTREDNTENSGHQNSFLNTGNANETVADSITNTTKMVNTIRQDSLALYLEDSEIQGSADINSKEKKDSQSLFLEDSEVQVSADINSKETKDSQTLFLEDSEVQVSADINSKETNDSQSLFLEDSEMTPENITKPFQEEMDSSFEINGSMIPAHQPGGGLKYGGCETSDDEVCTSTTPIRKNTVFSRKSQDYDSETASQSESPVCSTSKLYTYFTKDVADSQNYNDLLSLCSGKFGGHDRETSSSHFVSPVNTLSSKLPKTVISDTQNMDELLNLCSGRFPYPNKTKQEEEKFDMSFDDSLTSSIKKVTSVSNVFGSPVSTVNQLLNKKQSSISNTQNFNELLDLCSGTFSDKSKSGKVIAESDSDEDDETISSSNETIAHKTKQKEELDTSIDNSLTSSTKQVTLASNVFERPVSTVNQLLNGKQSSISNTQNFNELLDLCSGTFSDKSESAQVTVQSDSDEDDEIISSSKKKVARKSYVKLNFESEDESDVEKTEDPGLMETYSTDEEENNYSESETGVQDVEEPKKQEKTVLKVTDFFDDEAELSGSDVGSDDESEGEEGETIFDDKVPSDEEMTEEELRNQVGRVHLKHMMDDDKREIRFFQEIYLEDGDLHTDGNGRERKFRWRNVNYNESADAGEQEEGSGNELDQSIVEDEKWRVQRFEREKWLQEQEALQAAESWRGFKLVKRTRPSFIGTPNTNVSQNSSPLIVDQPKSFLARNKDFCSQLADKFQKQESEHVGRRSTKNFIFVSKSPVKSVKRPAEAPRSKEAKLKKLNTPKINTFKKKSIFNFI